mgnify:CR=1 FL=1
MNREDIIATAHKAGLHIATEVHWMPIIGLEYLERFAKLVAQAERNKVAQWMIQRSYATGHGDSVEDLLKELEWQVAEAENEACAKVCEALDAWNMDDPGSSAANAIRARGQA